QIVPAAASADGNGIDVNTAPAPDGTPVVTLYLDYQCPNCRQFEDTFGPMLASEAEAGTWTLQYKTLVFMDQNLQNTASTRAALAASCAADQGYYSPYHDTVFQNQGQEIIGDEGYSDDLLRDVIPNAIGMNADEIATFQQCYDDKQTSQFVADVDKSAYDDGVRSTPTLAVNGQPLDLSRLPDATPEGLKAFILANA
ncbi:MAG: DsbA family protein, partial [Propioniciclava sp.]